MDAKIDTRVVDTIRRTSAVIVASMGATTLLSWVLNIHIAVLSLGQATMKANTAMCFLLAGIALFGSNRSTRSGNERVVRALSFVVAAIGLMTLVEYAVGIDLGIDQILAFDTMSNPEDIPGRMSVIGALNFFLFGTGRLSGMRSSRVADMYFTAAWMVGAFASFLAIIGYAYGVPLLYHPIPATSIASSTALACLLLFIGLAASRPDLGLVGALQSRGAGGPFVRRLLPTILVLVPFLGWLRLQGEIAGLYDTHAGTAVYGSTLIVIMTTMLWYASRQADRLDAERQSSLVALQTQKHLLSTIVRKVPVAAAMFDRDMRYLEVSDRWNTDYGLTNAQIIGRSHYEIFPEMPQRWADIHRRCLAGEVLRNEDELFVRADGTRTYLRWKVRPWGNRDGRPEGILIFTEDITERKRTEDALRESHLMIAGVFETAAQAIIGVSADGTIRLVNKMAATMFGYERSELLGARIEKLLPEELRNRHAAHRASFTSNPRSRPMGTGIDLQGRRKDGSYVPLEVSLSHVETSQGILVVSMITDITARIAAAATLRNSERQLRELTARLLTAQEDERRRIARDLHDEIMQELAFLSIEIGQLAAADLPTEKRRDRLRALQSKTNHLANDVRRISHALHPVVIEDLGLGAALGSFIREFIEARGIPVRFAGANELAGLKNESAACLYRVAQECLQNAAKHARPKEITVSLRRRGETAELTVADDGIGFPANGYRGAEGLGVLSMKERVRAVHGTFSMMSAPRKGTEIRVSVPLAEATNA